MKSLVFFTIILLTSFSSFSQEEKNEMISEVTTYYFIRHAEKDRSKPSDSNPHLIQNGLNRAENWSKILGNIQFDAVYSTDFHRTIETAQPTAAKNNLDIVVYDPSSPNAIDEFLKASKGKTVLIVGHSNTTPAFVNAVIGKKKHEDIDDNNSGNLYIVTIIGDKIIDQVLTIN